MQPETPFLWPPTIDDIVGIVFTFSIVFLLIFNSPPNVPSGNQVTSVRSTVTGTIGDAASDTSTRTRPGHPVRLMIPRISVDAGIEYVGLDADGALGVPKNPSNTAWFDTGPRPGEIGNAVIDGHFGWKDGVPAVFDNLYKLQKGDMLYVEDENGETVAFVVREIRTYGRREDASDVFISGDGEAHLNLITCEGTWNAAFQSYSNRLVLFADKV